jgi:membrane dipeptidase
VRVVQITYNERNLVGNGCYERADGGLSHFGVDAVREMNRLGILIDLSHVGDRTTLDAIECSEQPVACTHANSRSFFDHVRNKTDEVLQRIADKGGVVGANAFPNFLPHGFNATLDDFLDAIDDLVARIGVDHVGIGTDYTQDQPAAFFDWLFAQQGMRPRPRPQPYPEPLPNVAGGLLRRGSGAEDVRKILGGNWLRLFRQVWR